MSETGQQRRLAAILAADVAGYTRAMGEDETGTLAEVQRLLREVVQPAIAGQNGRIFKRMGDGILAEFPSAVGAAQCAAAIQTAMVTAETALQFRIGLHVGDVLVEDGDLFGDGVNIASRLEAEAEPGAIVVSEAFRNHAEGRAGLAFDDLGSRSLKNVASPVHIYSLRREGGAARPVRRTRRLIPAAIGAAAAALLALVTIWAWPQLFETAPPLPQDGPPAVAVLSFDNLSQDVDQAYFAEGLAEDLISDLSKIEGVRVISRTSSFAVDGKKPVREIARELTARYIVEGSVRRLGGSLRITASLIDASSDSTMDSKRFDGTDEDVFAFQDEIVEMVIGALELEPTPGELTAVEDRGTGNPEAFDAYIRGMRLLSARKRLDSDANAAAQAAFKTAIEIDPNYARAYAGLAWAKWLYVESVNVFNREADTAEAFELAERSIALGDNALAHRVLARRYFALMSYWVRTARRVDLAIQELEAARRLQPNDPDLMADLAIVLNFGGQPEKALELVQNAVGRNPYHPDWYYAPSGIALMFTGHYDRAVEDLTRWTNSLTSWNVPHLFRGAALALAGREAEGNLSVARYEFLSNTLSPTKTEALRKAEAEGVESLSEPLRICTTTYAIKSKWPMQSREEEIFYRGLAKAGLTDTPC